MAADIYAQTLTYEQFLDKLNRRINTASNKAKLNIGLCQIEEFGRIIDSGIKKVAPIGVGLATAGALGYWAYNNLSSADLETFRTYAKSIPDYEHNAIARINTLFIWITDFLEIVIPMSAPLLGGIAVGTLTDKIINQVRERQNLNEEEIYRLRMMLDNYEYHKNSLKRIDNRIVDILPVELDLHRRDNPILFSDNDVEQCFSLLDRYPLTTIIYAARIGMLDKLSELSAKEQDEVNRFISGNLYQLHDNLENLKVEEISFFATTFNNYYNYRCSLRNYNDYDYQSKDFNSNSNLTFEQVIDNVYKRINSTLSSINKQMERLARKDQTNTLEYGNLYEQKKLLNLKLSCLENWHKVFDEIIPSGSTEMLFNSKASELIFQYLGFLSIESLIFIAFTGNLSRLDHLNYIHSIRMTPAESPLVEINGFASTLHLKAKEERTRLQHQDSQQTIDYIEQIAITHKARYA